MADAEFAARFALEHGHYREDLEFWRESAARLAGPVLDLGAATGRIALPLAADGHEVWALDRSPRMCAALARAAAEDGRADSVRVVCDQLSDFELPQQFALAIVAMNTFQVLHSEQEQLSCMRAAARHLRPGGELILDVAVPDPRDIAGAIGEVQAVGSHVDSHTGTRVDQTARYDSYDPDAQLLRFTLIIEESAAGGARSRRERPYAVHLYAPDDLRRLALAADLRPIDAYADFDQSPLTAAADRQVHRFEKVPA